MKGRREEEGNREVIMSYGGEAGKLRVRVVGEVSKGL